MNYVNVIVITLLAAGATKAVDIDPSICKGINTTVDVLLPNPNDCTSYIQCVNEEPVIMPCPEGTHWNAKAKKCQEPELANCEIKMTKWASCQGVPENINVLLPNPKDCGSFIQCVHQKPVVMQCPNGLHWSVAANRCEWPENANCKVNSCEGVPENVDVLLPNPEDCGSYIQCVHQKPVVRPCPGGLHWSVANNRCEWPNVAQCNVPVLIKKVQTKKFTSCDEVPENINVLLPNPKDCGSFIQCVHQKPVVMQCPNGLQWSIAATRCEWPENANCKVNSCEGVPENVDVLLPNPEDCGSYIQCVHQKPVVRPCPGGLHWSVASNRCDWPNIAGCEFLIQS